MNRELLNLYFKIENRLNRRLRAQAHIDQLNGFISKVQETMRGKKDRLPRGEKMMEVFDREVRPLSNVSEVLKKEAGIPAWERTAYQIILDSLSEVLGEDLDRIKRLKKQRETEKVLDDIMPDEPRANE